MLGFAPYSGAALADFGSGEQLFIPTGVVGTGAIGTVLVTGNQSGLTLGSVEGTASSNGVTVDGGATATFTMAQLNGSVGSVIGQANAQFAVTGIAGAGSVGSVTVINASVISPTGVQATGAVNDVTVVGTATFSITGVAGTTAVGTATADAGAGAVTTGVFATGAVNSVSITGSATIIPIGVSAQGQTGNLVVWGPVVPNPGTIWTPIAA